MECKVCDSKVCAKCSEEKSSQYFSVDKKLKDGLSSWCKPCRNEYKREKKYRYVPVIVKYKSGVCSSCNTEHHRIVKTECYPCYNTKRNRAKGVQPKMFVSKEEQKLKRAEYHKKRNAVKLAEKYRVAKENGTYIPKRKELTSEQIQENILQIKKREREKNRAAYITRARDRQLRRKEQTLPGTDFTIMNEIYKVAKELTNSTGIIHHVDHIIPLKNDYVCGLNIPQNLQILTANENCRKSNKFDFTYDNLGWKNV